MMRCTIWYHLCNLKNVKNTHGGVLILVKLQIKINTPSWVSFTFLKLYKWYQIAQHTTNENTGQKWVKDLPLWSTTKCFKWLGPFIQQRYSKSISYFTNFRFILWATEISVHKGSKPLGDSKVNSAFHP